MIAATSSAVESRSIVVCLGALEHTRRDSDRTDYAREVHSRKEGPSAPDDLTYPPGLTWRLRRAWLNGVG